MYHFMFEGQKYYVELMGADAECAAESDVASAALGAEMGMELVTDDRAELWATAWEHYTTTIQKEASDLTGYWVEFMRASDAMPRDRPRLFPALDVRRVITLEGGCWGASERKERWLTIWRRAT